MFGRLKNLFSRAEPAKPTAAEPVSVAAPPPAPSSPPKAPAAPKPPSPQGSVGGLAPSKPAPSTGETISVRLERVLAGLPDALSATVQKPPGAQARLAVSIDTILQQMPHGSVKVPFADLLAQAPAGTFGNTDGQEQTMVDLPMAEIFPQLKPQHYARRSGQKTIDIPDEVVPLFGAKGEPLTAMREATTLLKKSVPSPAAEAPAAAPAHPPEQSRPIEPPRKPSPIAPPPAPRSQPAPPPAPAPIKPSSPLPAPPAAPAQPIRPSSKLPEPGSLRPAAPPAPPAAAPPAIKAPSGLPDPASLRSAAPPAPIKPSPSPTPAAASAAPPLPSMARPAEPRPPSAAPPISAPSLPAPAAAKPAAPSGSVPIPLAAVVSAFPEPLQSALTAAGASTIQFLVPAAELDTGLKRARLSFSWAQLKGWIQPANPALASEHDGVEIELPLGAVAPLFMTAVRPTKPQKKITIGENIPDLFSARGPVPALSTAPQEPPVAAAPAPAPAPAPPTAAAPPPTPRPTAPAAPPAPAAPRKPQTTGEVFGQPAKKDWSAAEIVQAASGLKGIAGAVIATADGLLVAAKLSDEGKAETFAAFLPQAFGRMSQYAAELNLGELRSVAMVTAQAPCEIYKAGDVFLAVLGSGTEPLPSTAIQIVAEDLGRGGHK